MNKVSNNTKGYDTINVTQNSEKMIAKGELKECIRIYVHYWNCMCISRLMQTNNLMSIWFKYGMRKNKFS